MDLGIKGKWALVCGASKGLGMGCAIALAAEGVNVVIVARGMDVLQQTAQQIMTQHPQVKVLSVAADITTEAGRQAAFSVAGGPGWGAWVRRPAVLPESNSPGWAGLCMFTPSPRRA